MTEQTTQEVVEKEQVDTQQETTKTFTKEEVNKLIKSNVDRAVAKAHKEAQAQADEVEKLKQMNYEQKAKYEQDKANQKIAELEAEITKLGLKQEASNIFQKEGMQVNDDILNLVVKNDAESTQVAVNNLINLVNDLVSSKLNESLKGRTPVKVHNTNGLSKDEFNKLSYSQRAELFQQNPTLYNELKG